MPAPLLQADLLSALSTRFGSAAPHAASPSSGSPPNQRGASHATDRGGGSSSPHTGDLPSQRGDNVNSGWQRGVAALGPEGAPRWPPREWLSTGIVAVDSLAGGLPRGAITEICGGPSSGRTSLLVSVLAQATARREVCALLDATDAFDPASAAQAGVDLDRLLWVRCAGNAEHALKATDWLLQGGGFGVVAFDLADVHPATTRRISLTSWFRLRRAVEHTPTVLLVLAQEPQAKSCSSLILEARSEKIAWSGSPSQAAPWSRLFRGASHRLDLRKPLRSASATFRTELWDQAHRNQARTAAG